MCEFEYHSSLTTQKKQNMLKFIFNKIFLINIAILLLLVVVIMFSVDKLLDNYTNHGQSISVPSLEGLTENEVATLLADKELRYEILDSIFIDKKPKGVVVDQNPKAEALVKKNRKIYLTLTKINPPKISLPDVIGMSQRLAVAKIESYGLKVKIQYKPSQHQGNVIDYLVKEERIKPNAKIALGSTITIVVGTGKGDGEVLVPYLLNLAFDEAEKQIQVSALSLGLEIYDESCKNAIDSANAKVYKQTPHYGAESVLNIGSAVDIYLTCDTNKIKIQKTSLDSSIIDN